MRTITLANGHTVEVECLSCALTRNHMKTAENQEIVLDVIESLRNLLNP
ncbi:hypothetical protein [Falsibacillus pallidus]|uniref:Uncharacterized protein n=1 Tax=Falsibacillus pallidus TaxID=493781 RepID=A0A370GPH7_9BACI|nr:hypothetical protein [Falsibacillus pallidus]RDI45635.1 hypothetical protein DFR59_102266 [Falsibacillus pallidus]